MSDALYPSFDKSGKYLFFTASTDMGLTTGWLDMTSEAHPVTRSAYVAVLRKDLPSPLAPESDDEKAAEDKEKEKSEKEKPKKEETAIRTRKKRKAKKRKSRRSRKKRGKREKPKNRSRSRSILKSSTNASWRFRFRPGTMWGWRPARKECSSWPRLLRLMTASGESAGMTIQRFDLEKRKTEKLLDGVTCFIVASGWGKDALSEG